MDVIKIDQGFYRKVNLSLIEVLLYYLYRVIK